MYHKKSPTSYRPLLQALERKPKPMATSYCPACHTAFDPRLHLAAGGGLGQLFTSPPRASTDAVLEDNARVRCPSCGHEFVSQDLRFFGVLSIRGIRTVIAILVFCFLFIVALLVFSEARASTLHPVRSNPPLKWDRSPAAPGPLAPR